MIETRQHSVQSFTSCICLSSAIRHSSTPLKNVLEKKGVCIVAGVKKEQKNEVGTSYISQLPNRGPWRTWQLSLQPAARIRRSAHNITSDYDNTDQLEEHKDHLQLVVVVVVVVVQWMNE